MIVEPVLGEGGYVVPPGRVARRAARALRPSTASCSCSTRCRPASAAPADPFAAETFGVRPDVLLFAKGVASGLPLGGIVRRRRADGPVAERHPRLDLRRQPGVAARPRSPRSRCSSDEGLYDRARDLGEVALARLQRGRRRQRRGRRGPRRRA